MTQSWTTHLTADTVAEVCSFLDEDTLYSLEDAECLLDDNSATNIKPMLMPVTERQWKNLFELDQNRRNRRWSDSTALRSFSCYRQQGREYVRGCRKSQTVVKEAHRIYDFDRRPAELDIPNKDGVFQFDQMRREVPLRNLSLCDSKESSALHWKEWQHPGNNTTTTEEVFVTLTKRDSGRSWQGYCPLMAKEFTLPFQTNKMLKLDSLQELASELEWPELQDYHDWVEDMKTKGGPIESATRQVVEFISGEQALESIMRNMQVTVTTSDHSRIVIATGGFSSMEELDGTGDFHERHPLLPLEGSVMGVSNAYETKLELVNGSVVVSLEHRMYQGSRAGNLDMDVEELLGDFLLLLRQQ
mmetsp:Transcript_18398/g.34226  ORF Transcript_18398/g.34226 Transcript_18398/m.34226 type:complete len:359 (-) Transcript_18398:854-1930(-)